MDQTRGKMGILGPTTIVVMSSFVAKHAYNGGRKTVLGRIAGGTSGVSSTGTFAFPFALAGTLRLSLGATSVLGWNLALARAL